MASHSGILRESPSGTEIVGENDNDTLLWNAELGIWETGPGGGGGGAVSSVFGRAGDVVAELGDYTTGLIANSSLLPGATLDEALDFITNYVLNLNSSTLTNLSTVPGGSITDALDNLLALARGDVNSLAESFAGGSASTINASDTNANIGDNGWNYLLEGGTTGNSCVRLPGEFGALGIYRVTSPDASGARASLYLGAATVGIFDADNWRSCTFRARFNDDHTGNDNATLSVGVVSDVQLGTVGTGESAGFFAVTVGAGASPNYQTVTSHLSSGNIPQDTGVPVDDQFHNFTIRRLTDAAIEFYIDGVLRTTHTTPDGDGMPVGPLVPNFSARAGATASTFIDADAFSYVPNT